MKLYYNPVSTYSQKVLMALYEKNVSFERNLVNLMDPAEKEKYKTVYPLGKVPTLIRDDGRTIPESTIIIEYLETAFTSGTKLIYGDAEQARQIRFMDRMSDLYVNESVATIFFSTMRPIPTEEVDKAKFRLNTMYEFMDKEFATRTWAAGKEFSMADCSLAPGLGYATKAFPFTNYKNVSSYWNRIAERPSYGKVMEEATPLLKKFAEMAQGTNRK